VLSQHPLSQRIGTQAELQRLVEAWQQRRNLQAVTVDWRFTTEDARIKLKYLYPTIEGKDRMLTRSVPTCRDGPSSS
jgi:hypothetical protein